MGGKAPPDPELNDSDAEFVEVDPTGRYGRVCLRASTSATAVLLRGAGASVRVRIAVAWIFSEIFDRLLSHLERRSI